MTSSTHSLPSLRTELLLNIAVLAAAALLIAVISVLLFGGLVESDFAALYLVGLIAADVAVLVLFGAYQVQRLVNRPLGDVVAAAEAIADGDLARRVPAGTTRELAALSASVNRMTDHLLNEQVHRTRVEKLATVGRLAAGIAHEIGNPLGAINGYTHILRRRVRHDDDAGDALDGLERESSRIDRIVRGLLDYSRPRRPTPTPIDLNDVARSVASMLSDQGVTRRIKVRLLLSQRDPVLFGERHELEQVFVNLLLNAADALGPEGGEVVIRTRRVSVAELLTARGRRDDDPGDISIERASNTRALDWLQRANPADEVAQVVVADSGPGIPPEDAERIFDPFYTTKEPGRGTGLGLAIVARIVENLRGAVWVQRAREGGAAFVMLFPLSDAPDDVATRTAEPARATAA